MGELRCVDGSMLSVEAVTCRDRVGQPYEITLQLSRNSVPFASIGQRCGYELARLAERVSAARLDPAQAATWPDPDDRFPLPGVGDPDSDPWCGLSARTNGRSGRVPTDHEYFALRSRDRVDPPGSGELRCVLRSSAVWLGECTGVGQRGMSRQRADRADRAQRAERAEQAEQAERAELRPPAGGHGSWRLTRRAVIEAWGAGGVGIRAVLTSAELMAFLNTVVTGLDGVAAAGVPSARAAPATEQSAGTGAGGAAAPSAQQRERVPDAIARSPLPALRTPAWGDAVASGDPPPRGGDVRR